MNNEARLSRWIDAIANDETCELEDIISHIQKHFGIEIAEEYDAGNLDQWLASSENLIDIFKKMAKLRSNTELRLQRLQEQVDRFPDLRTPEPTGHFTGRCVHCGSKDLWDDNLAYGCNCCKALLGTN